MVLTEFQNSVRKYQYPNNIQSIIEELEENIVSSIICYSKKNHNNIKFLNHSLKKKKKESSNKIKDNPSFLFFKFLCWPCFQSFSVAMTYRGRNSKKEQAEHRTVTIRQIWIASKGVSQRRIPCTLSQQANKHQSHEIHRSFHCTPPWA